MPNENPIYTKKFISTATTLLLSGAFLLATALMAVSDLISEGTVTIQPIIGLACASMFGVSWIFLKNNRYIASHWTLLSLLIATSLFTLFCYGVGSPLGLLTLATTLLVPGTLLQSRYTLPFTVGGVIAILTIHTIHALGYYPLLNPVAPTYGFIEVSIYASTIAALVLVSQLSVRRSEYSLKRARRAEKNLLIQKESLRLQLVEETAKLRSNQFKEMQQLYAFAALGQNAIAALHELSNHLSILGIDIEDLSDEHPDAVTEARNSFQQISSMVKTIRRQLDTYSSSQLLKPYTTIRKVAANIQASQICSSVKILVSAPKNCQQTEVNGEPTALSHILTILIKNSIEACTSLPNSMIHVFVTKTKANLRITITDNGIGIPQSVIDKLFLPKESTKPTGLGAGLFIASSLLKTHFKGSISLVSNGEENTRNKYLSGATFSLYIPLK